MSKLKIQMPNEIQSPNDKTKVYDLEERTAKFGECVIDFVKTIEKLPLNPYVGDIKKIKEEN